MKYHNITKADMLNGEGLRVVLWTSGCSHNCTACQNAITWNCNDGLDFDLEAKEEIFKELEQDYCSGLTLSGGDPLFIKNREDISKLVVEVSEKFPNKTIWIYTGYTFEELLLEKNSDKYIETILNNTDVLLDGKFIIHLAQEKLHYVGSSNQCIIDVKNSLKENRKILYIDNSKLEGEN